MPDKNGKLRPSDVAYMSITMKPHARCWGSNDESCVMPYQEGLYATTKASVVAKQHILDNPTHIVEVVQERVSKYYLPGQMLFDRGLIDQDGKPVVTPEVQG